MEHVKKLTLTVPIDGQTYTLELHLNTCVSDYTVFDIVGKQLGGAGRRGGGEAMILLLTSHLYNL